MDMRRIIARAAKDAGGMSSLARLSGLNRTYLHDMQNGQQNPTVSTLEALGYEVKLRRVGFAEKEARKESV